MAGKSQPQYFPLFFGPDLDPSWNINPGVIINGSYDIVPSKRDTLKVYYCSSATESLSTSTYGTFREDTYGKTQSAIIVKRTDGTARLIAGTDTRLMENTTTGWVDVSLGSTAYATVSDWCYTTFGNDLIAVSKQNAPQVSTAAAAAFANLGGGPPKAAVCTTNKNFVLLGNCNDGTNDLGDQVWWSALGNDASWTVSASTQAGNYRIRDTPGKITALVNMRDAVVAYKDDSVYIGDYQGSPLLWTWRLVTDRAGCGASHGVAVVNGIHYFLHRTGVKRFDGASVQDIGNPVNRFLFDKMSAQVNYSTVQAAYDEYENVVYWFFSGSGASSNFKNYCLTYNVSTGKFGFIQQVISEGQRARAVISATLSDVSTWASALGTGTMNVFLIGFDNGLAQGGHDQCIMYRPKTGSDVTGTQFMTFITGDIGDESVMALLSKIRIRAFSTSTEGSAGLTVKSKAYESAAYDSGTTYSTDGVSLGSRFTGLKSNRWFQITYSNNPHTEIAGIYLWMQMVGSE